jgi:hypothetical protein
MKKDAVITVRVSRASRRRIEEAARREGRSLSQLVERLIESGLATGHSAAPGASPRPSTPSLAGSLGAGRVPTLADFRQVRSQLSSSFARKARR